MQVSCVVDRLIDFCHCPTNHRRQGYFGHSVVGQIAPIQRNRLDSKGSLMKKQQRRLLVSFQDLIPRAQTNDQRFSKEPSNQMSSGRDRTAAGSTNRIRIECIPKREQHLAQLLSLCWWQNKTVTPCRYVRFVVFATGKGGDGFIIVSAGAGSMCRQGQQLQRQDAQSQSHIMRGMRCWSAAGE